MEPKKFRNSYGMHSGSAETVAVRCSTRHRHWWRVGSRAAADEDNKTGGSGMSSSSLSSYAGGEGHRTCNNKKTHKQQSILIFLSFSDLLSVLPFSDLFLLQSPSFFVSPSSLFQVAGGMSKGRLTAEFLSCLHSC